MAVNITDLLASLPYVMPLATLTSPGAVLAQGGPNEQNLGAITIGKDALGADPSGTLDKSYIWRQVEKRVELYWFINYATPGLLIRSMSTPLPADCPVPWTAAKQKSNAWAYLGAGGIFSDLTLLGNGGAMAGIFKNSAGNFELRAGSGSTSLAAGSALGFVSYFTAS